MAPNDGDRGSEQRRNCSLPSPPQEAEVAQALEIARETPTGAQDPSVSGILERELATIWQRIEAMPGTYVMTREEFSVFNFFQDRFVGNKLAVAARRRYWDNLSA